MGPENAWRVVPGKLFPVSCSKYEKESGIDYGQPKPFGAYNPTMIRPRKMHSKVELAVRKPRNPKEAQGK
jgi:hypothetical protein